MKISNIFVACILLALQYISVECGQALGNRIANMDLSTTAHRDSLYNGIGGNGGGYKNPNSVYKIWVKGTSSGDYSAVTVAASQAGCSVFSTNFNDQYYGIPMWGYFTARVRCSSAYQWNTLVQNTQFYTRVALTEKNFLVAIHAEDSDIGKKEYMGDPTGTTPPPPYDGESYDGYYKKDAESEEEPQSKKLPVPNGPTEEQLAEMRKVMDEQFELKRHIITPQVEALLKTNLTAQQLNDLSKRRYDCFEYEMIERSKLSTEELQKRIYDLYDCNNPNTYYPPPYYPPPYYPPPYYPPSPGYNPPYDCYVEQQIRNKDNKTVDLSDRRVFQELCPEQPPYYPPYTPPPPTHLPYVDGFEPSDASVPEFNWNYYYTQGRYLGYLDALGWSSEVEYYMEQAGGSMFMFEQGVYEQHPEFTYTDKLRRLPNYPRGGATDVGFIEPTLLAQYGKDPYREDDPAHGTTIAAELVGTSLGMARTVPLYHAKVITQDTDCDVHGLEEAIQSATTMVLSGAANRPALMLSSMSFRFSDWDCFEEPSTRGEDPCTQGVMDALETAYNNGIMMIIPAGNGIDVDVITNYPNTQTPFPPHNPPVYWLRCDTGKLNSPVSIDICKVADWHTDYNFNVWDNYYPLHQNNFAFKPFIVSHNDYWGRMSRYRVIQYSSADQVWTKPWWSIGSPNNGACVDFSAPAINIEKTAALDYVYEDDSHLFRELYRTAPYHISGSSFATPMVAAVTMHAMARYPPSHWWTSYSGYYVELIRNKLKENAKPAVYDYDVCRSNNWNDASELSSIPRVKFFYQMY